MADLTEGQWELGGVVFGLGCPIQHEPNVSPGSAEVRTQNAINPVGDNIRMGRDRRTPGSWKFQLFTDQHDLTSALDTLDELATVWDAEDVRSTPDAVMALRYNLDGTRTRRVYGRPRRWTAPLDNRSLSGLIMITADFDMVSPLFFDDIEESEEVSSRPAESTGGFTAPFVTPLTTLRSASPIERSITVRGRKSTPMMLDFHGPSLDPVFETPYWKAALRGSIPANEVITLDARPWVMAAYRSDGTTVSADMIPRTTLLSDLTLPKGEHRVSHTSKDTSGQSKVTVRWHNAHVSP